MKLFNAPRQPFVGLAVMAAIGIIVAEILPLPSVALTVGAIVLAGASAKSPLTRHAVLYCASRPSPNALRSRSGEWHATATRRWQPESAHGADVARLYARRTLPRAAGRARGTEFYPRHGAWAQA